MFAGMQQGTTLILTPLAKKATFYRPSKRRGGRAAEGPALEKQYPAKSGIVGSNPTLSAIFHPQSKPIPIINQFSNNNGSQFRAGGHHFFPAKPNCVHSADSTVCRRHGQPFFDIIAPAGDTANVCIRGGDGGTVEIVFQELPHIHVFGSGVGVMPADHPGWLDYF